MSSDASRGPSPGPRTLPNAMKMLPLENSITSAVLPSRPPTLLPPGAIKNGLSELLIDVVVGVT